MKLITLRDHRRAIQEMMEREARLTENQVVIELRRGQRKNALKFGAFMVLMFMALTFITWAVAVISRGAIGGIINGL